MLVPYTTHLDICKVRPGRQICKGFIVRLCITSASSYRLAAAAAAALRLERIRHVSIGCASLQLGMALQQLFQCALTGMYAPANQVQQGLWHATRCCCYAERR